MKKILLLSLTLIFAAELEVDGNLKVTGSVDVQNNPIKNVGPPTTLTDAVNGQVLQDALRETGPFEYRTVSLRINGVIYYDNNAPTEYRRYKDLEDIGYVDNNFDEYISSLTNQGYNLYHIAEPIDVGDFYIYLYTFRKPLADE